MSEDVGADRRTDKGAAVDAGALFGPSMDCDEAVHELYHYLDGELTEERRTQIRVHLDWCGPCGGAAEFEAELRHVIASHCKDRVPQSLIDRVAHAIDEESRQHHGKH
jgi:mycothiol system anti-sigma-R factor